MKRVFVPTVSGSDWQRLLAKPKLQWKTGASAMTAAAAWDSAADRLPPEITALLDSSRVPSLMGLQLLAAIPEWQVSLPGGATTSCTDVLAICRNDAGLCILGVEAKVLEDFGPLVETKRHASSAGQNERLAYLHALLGVDRFDDSIRYQLLHRTASALLTARDFHASTAVMLVHSFDTPVSQRADFEAFRIALGAKQVGPALYEVPAFESPALYLAWCEGDSKYRKEQLPSLTTMRLTAVFEKVPEGYIAFVEELPGVNTQAPTIEQARLDLVEAVELVLRTNRSASEEALRGRDVMREPMVMALN